MRRGFACCSLWWGPAVFLLEALLNSWVSKTERVSQETAKFGLPIYLHYISNEALFYYYWSFRSVVTGSNGRQKFCIEKVGSDSWLPRAHTWYVWTDSQVHDHEILEDHFQWLSTGLAHWAELRIRVTKFIHQSYIYITLCLAYFSGSLPAFFITHTMIELAFQSRSML